MTTALKLCLVTATVAAHLGMAAHAAGGWIAVDPGCRYAVDALHGAGQIVALLPADWSESASRPLSRGEALQLADRLERAARWGGVTAPEFSRRIRAQVA
ncbi:MAG TPA: hypothetical protein VFO62_10475 [Candidatus Binatia bacterium]|nr:hypothetical protein [Candidatus Binatia bacterium]